MDDPHLDQSIPDAVKAVEKPENEKETEQKFLSIWWFSYPLLAGIFGPMASAFSLCALVVPWRVWIPPGKVEGYGNCIDNPTWLTAIHATQLALALISNLFLYLNMARRVRFSVAQPIAIVGWYISSITLILLTGMAAGPLKVASSPDHALSQAFYYATFSAGLYFLVATMMLVTVIGKYKGHYDEELKLTMSQRTLMLQTVSSLFYLLLGAAVYKHIEDWEYLDAVYWADNTILTVGLGDYVPTTNLGRGLLIPFAIGGIITSGLIVSSIRSLVVERGKVIAGARTVEKQRRRALRKLQKQNETAVLTPIYSEPDTQISLRTSLGTFSAKQDGLTERQRRKQEFELMRQVQDNAINKRRWFSLLISGSVWFMLWLVSAFIFTVTEEAQSWSYFESVYFAYTSLLTIGYGDFHPESNAGKAFFVFWSLLAIPSLTILISNMGDTIVKVIRDVTLWVGVFTILPAEKGVKNTFKRAAIKMSKRKKIDVKETSSDMVRETNHDGQRSDGQRSQDSNLGSATGAARCMFSSAERDGIENKPNFLLRKEKDRHCLLIKEIGTVMTHVNSSPSRKYTFDEWAWYLELLGEDESDASTHKNPLGRPNLGGEGLAIAIPGRRGNERGQGEKKRAKWSWIGEQSPLMGNKEESEWLLERLTKTLEMELESMRLSIISDDLS